MDLEKASRIAKIYQKKTAYKDGDETRFESLGWCRSIIFHVMWALEMNRGIKQLAMDNGWSFDEAVKFCKGFSVLTGGKVLPYNTYDNETTFIIHLISEREGCSKGVVATWAPEMALKIIEAITEYENAEALQAT